jgi:hypothetical protein
MIDYFNLPLNSIGNKPIPKSNFSSRIHDQKKRELFEKLVKNIVWLAIIRQAETKIPSFENTKYKYEEIQILEIELNSYSEYNEFYYIATIINKCIPYPLIILIKFHEKYRLIMNLVRKNNMNYLLFKIDEIVITHWIYPKSPSSISNEILKSLNINLYQSKNNFELYVAMYNNIKKYARKCMQETTLYFFFSQFLKMDEDSIEEEIIFIQRNCIGEKYKPPESRNKKDIYKPQCERHMITKYQYDYEDIWNLFQQRIKIRNYLKAKNISSMIQLMYIINERKKSIYEERRNFGLCHDNLGNSYINDVFFRDEISDSNFPSESTLEPDVNDFDSDDYTKLMNRYEEGDE